MEAFRQCELDLQDLAADASERVLHALGQGVDGQFWESRNEAAEGLVPSEDTGAVHELAVED